MQMILASGSPRRKELLQQMGFCFAVQTAPADETIPPGMGPAQAVEMLAQRKAAGVAAANPQAVVVAADTVVAVDDAILGKPADAAQAVEMLTRLSGRTHQVYTGVCVACGGRMLARAVCTQVEFRPLSRAEIESYVATGDPMDKAGAYGIQNRAALFVKGIHGSYDNVVGLPLSSLFEMLCEILPGAQQQVLAMLQGE